MNCPDCDAYMYTDQCHCGFKATIIKLEPTTKQDLEPFVGVGKECLGDKLYEAIAIMGKIQLMRARQGRVIMGDLAPDGYKEKEQKLQQDLQVLMRGMSMSQVAELAEAYPWMVKDKEDQVG